MTWKEYYLGGALIILLMLTSIAIAGASVYQAYYTGNHLWLLLCAAPLFISGG
jgi:hypothetical protein